MCTGRQIKKKERNCLNSAAKSVSRSPLFLVCFCLMEEKKNFFPAINQQSLLNTTFKLHLKDQTVYFWLFCCCCCESLPGVPLATYVLHSYGNISNLFLFYISHVWSTSRGGTRRSDGQQHRALSCRLHHPLPVQPGLQTAPPVCHTLYGKRRVGKATSPVHRR